MGLQGRVTGVEEFAEFAQATENVEERLDEVVRRATRRTADHYIHELTAQIKQATTAKGGTFDSRTSPYSPGTTNDSSDDPYHIVDREAWITLEPSPNQAVVMPRPEVRDRAYWMEYGTPDHGPQGDTPMFFHVGGTTIVVTEKETSMSHFEEGEESVIAAFSDVIGAEPGEVEGVEPNLFFHRAALRTRVKRIYSKRLREELTRVMEEEY